MTKSDGMTYGGYLTLEPLLSAQHPISDHHDELLFIILHQTKELWLKQIVHELDVALGLVRADRLIEVHKNLSRVSRIQAVMTLSWYLLTPLTPSDYMQFRDVLGSSSGFQSVQFRQFEFLLGLKDSAHLRHQPEGSAGHEALAAALARPSLWDEAIAALAPGPRGPAGGPPAPEPVGRGDRSARPRRLRLAGRGARARLEPGLPAERSGGGGLGRGLSRHRPLLALLPIRREARRHRRCDGRLAPQACRHRRAGDRPQARHRRHRRRALSPIHGRQARLPRIVDAEDAALETQNRETIACPDLTRTSRGPLQRASPPPRTTRWSTASRTGRRPKAASPSTT